MQLQHNDKSLWFQGIKRIKGGIRKFPRLCIGLYTRILRALAFGSFTFGAVKGFYPETLEWVRDPKVERSGASYSEIYPRQDTKQNKPGTLDGETPWEFTHLLGGMRYDSRADFVVTIPNGKICGSRGSVITDDNQLLVDISKEFFHNPLDYSVFYQWKLPHVTRVEGTVAAMAVQDGHVYWHWMIDLLPRFHLLKCSGFEVPNIKQYVINPIHTRFQRETLEILGITKQMILETRKGLHIQADRVVATSVPDDAPNPWVYGFLKQEFLKSAVSPAIDGMEYLYLSRADARSRGIMKEDLLVKTLERFGFKSVTLNGRSVTEQASLFNNAKVIVAPHGSSLTNIAFCKPETKIIEIFPPIYINPLYWIVSNQLGLDYYLFIGEGERIPAPPAGADPQQWWWSQRRSYTAEKKSQGTIVDIQKFLDLLRHLQII